MKKGDSNVKVWISLCLLSTGRAQKAKGDQSGKGVSCDSLINPFIADGREGHLEKNKDRALKSSQAFPTMLRTRVSGRSEAGRPSTAPAVGQTGRRFKRLSFAGCGMPPTSAPASLIENIIFSINNTSNFFISKVPGKS